MRFRSFILIPVLLVAGLARAEEQNSSIPPIIERSSEEAAYCGGHGSPSRIKEKGITATPFEFKMPQ